MQKSLIASENTAQSRSGIGRPQMAIERNSSGRPHDGKCWRAHGKQSSRVNLSDPRELPRRRGRLYGSCRSGPPHRIASSGGNLLVSTLQAVVSRSTVSNPSNVINAVFGPPGAGATSIPRMTEFGAVRYGQHMPCSEMSAVI
jgi:hypothetical protein